MTAEQQESFSQENFDLQQLLRLDPAKCYTRHDLQDEIFLGRGLRLLYLAKFGRDTMYTRLSPHINYDKLPAQLAQSIKDKMEMEEDRLRKSFDIMGRAHL